MDFSTLNNFFDHIYIITLRRATERQSQIEKALNGLQYSFFYGADKKEFDKETLAKDGVYDEERAVKNHRYNKPMNGGQIGCSWSHKRVYEDVVKNNYRKVLVLEDDVLPNEEGIKKAGHILSQLPQGWELVYFDYHKNLQRNFGGVVKQQLYHLQKYLGKIKWSHKTITNLFARRYSENLSYAGFHDFTSAYAITLPAARKLIDHQTPIAFVADNLLAHACTNEVVVAFISHPKVFVQESQMQQPGARVSYVED
jgi:glycosyl transferase, family 25